jgi:hypothetical protein
MKSAVSLVLFFALLQHVLAQAPQDIGYYLSHPQIAVSAKDYYNGKFKASDDAQTFSILDSLRTKNDSTRPFYILLVSSMLRKSDGALSEALGNACLNFLESHANQTIAFLYSNTALVKSEYKKDWAKIVAGEFMIACEGKEKACLKSSHQKAMATTDPKNKKRLHDLYDTITAIIKDQEPGT